MKRILVLLLFFEFIFVGSSIAQTNDFNLSNYKLPTLKRQSLELNFYLSGSNTFAKYSDVNIYGKDEDNVKGYTGNIRILYNSFLNDSLRQRTSNAGVYLFSNYADNKYVYGYSYESTTYNPYFYYNLSNRKYFNANNFFEIDIDIDYEFDFFDDYFKSSSGSESQYVIKTHDILGYIPLKIGSGRIDPVQDARLAVYIYDELIKVNRINEEISDEDVIQLAKLISELKNKRFFDSRLRKIAELNAIDSFLISNTNILKSDSRYFTSLQDIWEYGDRPNRNAGTRYTLALYPGYYFNRYNREDVESLYNREYNLSALILTSGFEFKHEKPINLYWQNTIDFNTHIGIVDGNANYISNTEENALRIPNLQLNYTQTIGFYPNTRTDIVFSYGLQYAQIFDKSDVTNNIDGSDSKGVRASSDLAVNYYISPKLRLNLRAWISYVWQDSDKSEIIDFSMLPASNYVNRFSPDIYNGIYKQKQFKNGFRISLLYSIF